VGRARAYTHLSTGWTCIVVIKDGVALELALWLLRLHLDPPPPTHPTRPSLQQYDRPTILLARRVTGEEEPPTGVVGVLSGDSPDVLSHLSVRSRNMGVLFATCHDSAELDAIAELEGGCERLGVVGWDGGRGGDYRPPGLPRVERCAVPHRWRH
jgi:hypothetical protein